MQCMRGFSYMPQKLLDSTDLKLIETEELDRTWRSTRRERLKQQEKKIYEEFVKEKDVVYSVLEDDRYQFIYELPETCIRELMELKPKPLQKDDDLDTQDSQTDTDPGTDTERQSDSTPMCSPGGPVEEHEGNNNDIFHIFDDDTISGDEPELCCEPVNGSMCTVREKSSKTNLDYDEHGVKPESVPANTIENSIYCGKVKDLRLKIDTELKEMYTELEGKEMKEIDTEPLKKIMKCANEFCARFNRVHMYQMKRQIGDIERHNSLTLPFAKHTQFQSQMVRIISLHQNLLHSLQVFHKSYEQTLYLRDCVPLLRALAQLVRTITDHCQAVDCPPDFSSAKEIYCDDIAQTTEKLEGVLTAHAARLAAMLAAHHLDDPAAPIKASATKVSLTGRDKRRLDAKSKRAEVESRLKMYSLEVRRNPHAKAHALVNGIGPEPKPAAAPVKEEKKKEEIKKEKIKEEKETEPTKKQSRRPLMRGPISTKGPPKHKVLERDSEIKTMVENFDDAASSYIGKDDDSHFNLKTRNPTTPRSWMRKEAVPTAAKNVNKPTTLRVNRPIERTPRSGSPKSSPKRREKKIYHAVNKILTPLVDPQAAKIAHVQQIKVKLTPRGRNSEGNEESANPATCDQKTHGHGEESSNKNYKSTQKEKKVMVSPEMVSTKDKKNNGDKVSEGGLNHNSETREVSQLLRRLCCGDALGPRNEERHERVSGSRNAQLICTTTSTPRHQPSTTELLRILEETIQKKTPRELTRTALDRKDLEEKLRLVFKIPERVSENVFQYRTKFVQHMLASPMYANSVVGKPWEVVSRVSEEMMEEMLLRCAMDMEIQKIIREMYVHEIC